MTRLELEQFTRGADRRIETQQKNPAADEVMEMRRLKMGGTSLMLTSFVLYCIVFVARTEPYEL